MYHYDNLGDKCSTREALGYALLSDPAPSLMLCLSDGVLGQAQYHNDYMVSWIPTQGIFSPLLSWLNYTTGLC